MLLKFAYQDFLDDRRFKNTTNVKAGYNFPKMSGIKIPSFLFFELPIAFTIQVKDA